MSLNQHHANLLVGKKRETELYFKQLCKDWVVKLANNPNYFPFPQETFGINEARELKLLSLRKALASVKNDSVSRKIFLLTPTNITREAQNALLKTFEDPSPNTYFFLVVKEESVLIKTLRSRMEVVKISSAGTVESNEAERFLALSLKDRLVFAKKFSDEERSVTAFLDDILLLLRQKKETESFLERVFKLRCLISGETISSRMIIEHLSLVL